MPRHGHRNLQTIRPGWKEFTTIKDMLKAKLNKILCANLFSTIIFPVMLLTSKMWATTKKEEQKLVATQRNMERFLLELSLCEHI